MRNNPAKAVGFTVVVLLAALMMGLVLKLPGQIYMFAPALATLILMLVTGELFKRKGWAALGLGKAGFNYWGFALITPMVVLTVAYLVLWATPYASFAVPEGAAASAFLMIPVKLLIAIPIYTVTSSLGEEIGWRGYLLPKLAKLGWAKAMLVVGVIHAVFHFPIMLAGNYHTAGHPWIVTPMFVITVILLSFVLGATRIATGSVWPAAIMHAVHNVIWAALGEFTQTSSDMAEYIGGECGIVAIVLYGAAAVWLYKKVKHGSRRAASSR